MLALSLAGGAARYGQEWWRVGRFLQTTDDAYTASDAVGVGPRVAGQVAEVRVTDNQVVHAGQVLARLDDRDFRVTLAAAEAEAAGAQADLRTSEAQLALQQASIAQAATEVTSAEAALRFAQADYGRYTDLMTSGNGTVQRAQQAEADIREKTAALARARAAQQAAVLQVAVLQAQRAHAQALLARAQAEAAQARLSLAYTTVTSPVDGAVGDRSARVGQYVQAGTRLMTVVPVGSSIYVLANFKETQLAHVLRGEGAQVSLDMLDGAALRGRVDSLAPGSGATFALLPPENATGNFTKIVQRVPVKIVLEGVPADILARLRPGLSVTASVDIRTAPPGPAETLAGENVAVR